MMLIDLQGVANQGAPIQPRSERPFPRKIQMATLVLILGLTVILGIFVITGVLAGSSLTDG